MSRNRASSSPCQLEPHTPPSSCHTCTNLTASPMSPEPQAQARPRAGFWGHGDGPGHLEAMIVQQWRQINNGATRALWLGLTGKKAALEPCLEKPRKAAGRGQHPN